MASPNFMRLLFFAIVKENQLKIFISQYLPFYMIPENIFLLESLPLMDNGKVNYKALAKLMQEIPQIIEQDDTPSSETEKKLVKIWAEVLGSDKAITRTTSFFLLGGNSILAIRLLEMIRHQFGVEIKLVQLMEHQSIKELIKLFDDVDIEIEEGII